MTNVINFQEYKEKMDPDEQKLRQLAKKVVDAFRKNGEEGYMNAIMSVTRGDSEFLKLLTPFIEEEIKVKI